MMLRTVLNDQIPNLSGVANVGPKPAKFGDNADVESESDEKKVTT